MGIWYYQIFKKDSQYYIGEYYPADSVYSHAWTEGSEAATGDTKDELINDLCNMLTDALNYGVRDSETGELIEE